MEELRARGKALEKRRRELQEACCTKEEEQQSGFSYLTVPTTPGVKIPLGTSTVAAKEVLGKKEELQQRGRKRSLHKEQEEVSCCIFLTLTFE